MKLPKRYDSEEAEKKWLEFWEKEKIYEFDRKSRKPIYSIDTPPPTVSGEMHIGHAYSYSQMDMIARYKRMAGYNVFYPFGTDDNGLPTERLIERKKNIRHQKMDRSEFIDFCLKVLKEELRPEYIKDWKKIGISADYSLFYTTINDHCRKISQESFIDLHKKGRIYRKEDPTIWCPKCHMALAQVELEDKELEGEFVDLIFKTEEGEEIKIATTRPELLSSCVAIFIHPKDKKNKKLLGKKAVVPLFNQKVPVLEDERIDMEKGTGAAMCCTFGDQTDIEWYRAHNLSLKISITEDGRMTETAGKYKGLKIKEARKKIIEDLEKEGLLKERKKITHTVNVHERCGTEIEILHTTQWFIKYLDIKKKLLKAGREMNWYPEHMMNRYTNWIEGLQWDWCISRQRFFGVPIPVWYCKECGELMLPEKESLPVDPLKTKPEKKCKCGSDEFEPEEDVLDTWATSSMTPQIAASLVPERYDDIYPMSLRPQAHDIITFWLFNTVVKSQLHNNKNPFKDVMISGWALDQNGKKMAKSKGNVVYPKEMIEKYSVDALRFWAAGSSLGEDLPFKEKDLVTGKKFTNKMWNASKFALMNLEDYNGKEPEKLRTVDRWILSKLNKLINSVTEALEKYEYNQLKRQTEDFFWHDFCDDYLEIIKDRLYNPDRYENGKESAQYTLYQIVLNSLKLMAPIMPYITEEIYHLHFNEKEKKKSIHISDWPKARKEWIDKEAEKAGKLLVQMLSSIRQYKQEKGLSLGAELEKIYIEPENEETEKQLELILLDLKGASRAKEIKVGKGKGKTIETEAPLKITISD